MRFDDKPDLHVEVQGDYVIITLPGTKYRVTYYKLDDRPELRAKSDWTDDPNAPVTLGAFRARAWIAANDKAENSAGLCDCQRSSRIA